jgi:hypothetical protein
VKIWLLLLLLTAPALAEGESAAGDEPADGILGWEASRTGDDGETRESWVDSSHTYAAKKAQAVTQWMDSYFGEPNYELETPNSLIRVDFTTKWDQEDGNNNNIRLRGKVYLPTLSKRVSLVFDDEQGDGLGSDDDLSEGGSNAGLVYEVSDGKKSRVDLTMGLRWNRLRPGVRYRYQGRFWDVNTYRLTQRLQWDNEEELFATSQAEINRVLSGNTVLRWNNKATYGQETDGTEWITRLSLFQRTTTLKGNRPLGISYYGSVKGVTDPHYYVRNYKLGVLLRRPIFRDYLFLELDPAYNYRKRKPEEKRQYAWSIELRFQIALQSNPRSRKGRARDDADKNKVSGGPAWMPVENGVDYQAAVDPFVSEEDL